MAFLSSLDICGSALTAQRFRSDIISQNITNSEVTNTGNGKPYTRKLVVFEERNESSFRNVLSSKMRGREAYTGGVRVTKVVEDTTPYTPVYNPTHPDANEDGYVMMPNVNKTEEMLDLMAASSAYDANLTALNAIKAMASSALRIGR